MGRRREGGSGASHDSAGLPNTPGSRDFNSSAGMQLEGCGPASFFSSRLRATGPAKLGREGQLPGAHVGSGTRGSRAANRRGDQEPHSSPSRPSVASMSLQRADMASIRRRAAYPALHLFLLHERNPIENRAQSGLKASQNRATKNRLPRTSSDFDFTGEKQRQIYDFGNEIGCAHEARTQATTGSTQPQGTRLRRRRSRAFARRATRAKRSGRRCLMPASR